MVYVAQEQSAQGCVYYVCAVCGAVRVAMCVAVCVAVCVASVGATGVLRVVSVRCFLMLRD